MSLSIGIIGTRGIPNHYGGFEQAAEYISAGLAAKGYQVSVYNSHKHPYKECEWNGVKIIHCYDAEHYLGTAGQFIYDLNCIRDAGKRNFDVLLFMGYTSSSVWGKWFPSNSTIISNMDGLEWKREKYTRPVQQFLRYAESLAVRYSDHCIADSPVIKKYLDKVYQIDCCYIPYGADVTEDVATDFHPGNEHYLLMARMEPENNIETILDGFHETTEDKTFFVIGSTQNKFGRHIVDRFKKDERIRFNGSVFNRMTIAELIRKSSLYFHGHSVGGTNPSLLQAMAGGALIAAHDNPFNRAVLQENAFFFSSAAHVKEIIAKKIDSTVVEKMIGNNLGQIRSIYNWATVVDQYEQYIVSCYNKKGR